MQKSDNPTIGEIIRFEREARNWKQAQLAERLGVTRGAVAQWETGETTPKRANEEKLISVLGLPKNAFGEPLLPSIAGEVDTPHRLPATFERKFDLPVYGSALGGDDSMLIEYEVVEYVSRPEEIQNAKEGFALYVRGESMSPAYRPGDRIWMHPTKPPSSGDVVLIIKKTKSGDSAMIKELVQETDTHFRVRQYNPGDEFDISRSDVVSFHKVGGKTNR